MPTEFISVLIQIGIAGIFIWYLREQVDKRDELIDRLYQKVELVQKEERDRSDNLCQENEQEIKRLRGERNEQYRQRIADKSSQEQLLWQIGETLNALAEAERRRQRRIGSGDG